MAKYKAYPEYKDSGVQSVGIIPHQWSVLKLKYIFEIKKRIAGAIDYDVLSVTQKGIKIKDIESGEGQLSMDYSKYQRVYPGDFAMNHMDLLTGYVDISNYDGVTSPDYRVFSVRDIREFYSRYYLYLLQDGYKQRRFFHLGQGSAHLGRWRLPTEAFNEIQYPCPSLEEQLQIATFLDHETAKIDKLIEKQQQLIELLKEKRQAVISHAVTKGLNPDVPMKDSGVEWLGEIPSHWEMKRLAYLGSARNGLTYSPESITDQESGTLVLRSSNIQNSSLCFDDNVYVNSSIPEQFLVKENDLLICSRNGSRNLIGKNALISKDAAGMAFGAFMAIFRSQINTYIFWVLNSPLFDYQSGSFLTSTINQLTIGNLNSMKVPVPTFKEQKEIVRYLSKKNNDFIELISKVNNSIALLQERRTALISAAVTGKIDVRDWVAPDMQDAEEPQETTT
ncbi:restriction endonuclease subunit S [Serratia marcescens]|uniref:restriction endonuclease subunit S n=1 Tax=Serratia marcescens TaxID=615 RepID=UPI000CDD822F|nr:restriction endonuclease subunit S [Serratia marcescens]POW87986.1 restriction endonuclease subunit S [Serratia marcescens]POW92167.1 restriction endonuclease subunit S [Serratia marcescens]POX06315.1 restriction endonuclease subunit S [Serratia marcescens]POX10401.1 restriction endonuclease subunit S [Serratia marcescens]